MNWLAAALLLVGAGRHYGYYLFPPELHAQVWNIGGAIVITIMLWTIAWRWRQAALVAIWWTFEEIQVITCSTMWMIEPWDVATGQDQCSALLGFDLSSIGLLMIGLVLMLSTRKAQ